MNLFKRIVVWLVLRGIEEAVEEMEKENNDFIRKANKFLSEDAIKKDYRIK